MKLLDGPNLCLGADPHPEILESWSIEDSLRGIRQFSETFLDCLNEDLRIVKPQVALYERFGSKGLAELERFMRQLGESGKYVIADAKRSDIGTSMAGYTSAWLSKDGPFLADALTVSPYLGVGALSETFRVAQINGKRVFVLVATSNSEAHALQSNGVASAVLKELAQEDDQVVGAVIGATVNLSEFGLSALLDKTNMPILAPGFGVQGGSLTKIEQIFGKSSNRVIANVSRSILLGPKQELRSRLQTSLGELS